MQAITTKYLGPTNSRGSRVVARCQAKRLVVSWDDALGVDENHDTAAKMLAEKLGWAGRWVGGALPDGTGNVYIHMPRDGADTFKVEQKETNNA